MELPSSDLLYSQSVQLCRGLVKLARGSWDGLASHQPILGSQGKGSPMPSSCYKNISRVFFLFYALAQREEIALGSAEKLRVR